MKRPLGSGRRRLLLGGILVAVLLAAGFLLGGTSRGPSDCDTVRALVAYNRQFTEQTKASDPAGNAEVTATAQYRDWAARLADYASGIADPALSGRAGTAADLAARTADLVPRYRARPDDAGIAREYARIGTEFGNAITGLDYECPARAS